MCLHSLLVPVGAGYSIVLLAPWIGWNMPLIALMILMMWCAKESHVVGRFQVYSFVGFGLLCIWDNKQTLLGGMYLPLVWLALLLKWFVWLFRKMKQEGGEDRGDV
jgi:hypothetical protein